MRLLRDTSVRARAPRAGETLVECLVAIALVASVALPALAVLRGALARGSDAARRADESASARPAAVAAAAGARLGREGMPAGVADAAPPGTLPPLRPATRVPPSGGRAAPAR